MGTPKSVAACMTMPCLPAARFRFPTFDPLRTRRLASCLRGFACLLALALLTACGSSKPPVAAGYHRVEKGETLYSIARRYDRSVADLVRWNRLSNPNQIEVSQVLRVAPPAGTSSASASKSSSSKTRAAAAQPAARPAARTPPPPAQAPKLAWPADGRSSTRSDRPGITISGAAGAPVRAAAGGRVQYAGNGLRGYGNLVIIGHGGNYLTIYAHNRRLLVSQGQQVRQGQQIAEMGNTDSAQVGLYFEVRYNGKPVDALRMLPKR